MPPAEIKPGFLYRHYSPVQGRDVWSLANAQGGFSYAMGQGSIQPASRLDIRATAQKTDQVLRELAPRWAGALKSFGAPPLIILDKNDQWTLLQRSSIPQVMRSACKRQPMAMAASQVPQSIEPAVLVCAR